MRKITILLIAGLFIVSCAGMQKAGKDIKSGPNYSGRWTGQSFIEGPGVTDNLEMTLVHEGDVITGVISDSQGYMSNAQLINVVLEGKTMSFSYIATTPMGNIQVDSTGTFSDDNKEFALTFTVPTMNIGGSAKLIRS